MFIYQIPELIQAILSTNANNNSRVCINIEGSHGIGKTTVIRDTVEKLGYQFVQVNMAEMQDPADFMGYPTVEYELKIDRNGISYAKWCDKAQASLPEFSKLLTGNTRMSYAAPEFIQRVDKNKPVVLLLDDWTRAIKLFMQAIMTLLTDHKYFHWALPEGSTIILSSNPIDGEYSVVSLDLAQKDRFLSFTVEPSLDAWVTWASGAGIAPDFIEFVKSATELIDGVNITYRGITNLFKALADINYEKNKATFKILAFGKGELVGSKLITFMDRLLTAVPNASDFYKAMTSADSAAYVKKLRKDVEGKVDLVSVFTTRLIAFSALPKETIEKLITPNEYAKVTRQLYDSGIVSVDNLVRLLTASVKTLPPAYRTAILKDSELIKNSVAQ